MRRLKIIVVFLFCTFPLYSFINLKEFWTIKINGKIVYVSNKDKNTGADKIYHYQVQSSKITSADTLEIQYFTGTPCGCVYNYSIGEYALEGERYIGETYKEQNTTILQSYKIPLLNIIKNGSKNSFKIVFFSENREPPRPLCRLDFN